MAAAVKEETGKEGAIEPKMLETVHLELPDLEPDGDQENMMFLEDLSMDLSGGMWPDKGISSHGLVESKSEVLPSASASESEMTLLPSVSASEVTLLGLRCQPDPLLVKAGECKDRQASESNDRWALRRAYSLRAALKWDMSVEFEDLSLTQLNELLANVFTRDVKVDGSQYPSSSLMSLMNAYNRMIRRASDARSVRGLGNLVERDFTILRHPTFVKTKMILQAAVRKSAKEGTNKKRHKVEVLTKEHEKAILADIDHQLSR